MAGPYEPPLTSYNPNTPSSSSAMDNLQPPPPKHSPTPPKHHSPHPGCPDTLECLADSESKPRDTFATIIRCAILSTPSKRMTLNCIYTAIEEKYPYYRDAGPGWKNTVRHVLSTSQQFEKSRRPITEPGKGGYWSVNKSLSKSDNPRNRRTNRSVMIRKEQPSIPDLVSPTTWTPQQEHSLHEYPYTPTSLNSPFTVQQETEPRSYAAQLSPVTQVAPPSHFQDPQSYNVVNPMPHLTQMTQYSHPSQLLYGYEKAPERPGWLAEVSWGTAPMGNVAAQGRQ